jgi:lipopolysaccharide transport system ATP-binding protein
MSETYIKVDHLSKLYRLGVADAMHDSLGGAIGAALKAPFKNFRKLQSLSDFKDKEDESVLWALRDVSFEVREGEVLGVVGKNGAGKSTLLKLLSRITLPSSGSIEISGRVVSLLEVGTGFHKELSGRENIYMNGTILGMTRKEIDRKFDEIVAFSGVERFIDTPVKRYSSGMQVRLAFSVAAHLEPEIMIIDEVLAVGDADFQKRCLGKMKDVSQQGRTVLFVSHNMQAVQSLCTRCIMMENGRKVMDGATDDVINYYLSKQMTGGSMRVYDTQAEAPGNDQIRLQRAIVYKNGSSPSEGQIMYLTDALVFEFAFWNNAPGVHLNLSLVLNTVKGEVIFNVVTDDKPIGEGLHVTKFHVPANLLNDNVYSVDLYFIKNLKETICLIENAVSFEVHDAPREKAWYGKWIGAVRPKFETTFEKESD